MQTARLLYESGIALPHVQLLNSKAVCYSHRNRWRTFTVAHAGIIKKETLTYHGTSLLLASPSGPWPLAYVLRWTARCHGWSSAVRIYLAGRAARVNEEARSAEDLMKDMVKL
jgi:hypothetical protein